MACINDDNQPDDEFQGGEFQELCSQVKSSSGATRCDDDESCRTSHRTSVSCIRKYPSLDRCFT